MRLRTAASFLLLVMLVAPLSTAAPAGQPPGGGHYDEAPEPVHLHLRAGTFDPLTDPVPGPAVLRQGSTHPFYVLQYDGPIRKAWRDAVAATGAELLGYLPDFAYFAWIPHGSMASVRALEDVRYIGPAHLAYRFDPVLWRASTAPQDLVFETWGGHALLDLAGSIVELGGTVLSVGYDTLVARLSPVTAILLANEPSLGVAWIEPYAQPTPHLDLDARTANARQQSDGPYQMTDRSAWSYNAATDSFEGWTGENVTVAVCDSGLDDTHPAFAGRIEGYYDYGGDGQADYYGHGTHCAGIVLGNGSWRASNTGVDGKYSGLAPEAGLVVQETLYGYGSIALWNRDTARSGATISSNSWGAGYFGSYSSTSRAYDDNTRDADPWVAGDQPVLFSFSAGNAGSYGADTISPPATAKNVITVGATGNDKWGLSHSSVADFSSRGPTDDGRLKPDVVIPGHQVVSARSTDSGACSGWYRPSDGQTSYVYASGTSMSAPGVAGAAAVLTQFLEEDVGMDEPSPALLKASLINGAQPLTGYDYPGMVQGWGLVDMVRTMFETGTYRIWREDQAVPLDTDEGSDTAIHWFMVKGDQPLKVTLVWTDPAGTTSSAQHLINDLDLEIMDPSGVRYPGNNFAMGQSQSDDTGYQDRRNNVEGFLVDSPGEGIWSVRVKAYNVPSGPQDFALVVSGNVEKGYVDLSPAGIAATPEGLEENHPARLGATLKNLGNRASPQFGYKVEHIHPDGRVEVVTTGVVPDLPGGATHALGQAFTGARGTHKLRVTVDPENQVSESNESNNVLTVEYFYKGYGVRASVGDWELEADPGQLVEFALSVRNTGNVDDEFKISMISAPEGWTAQLNADMFNLDPGGSAPVTLSVIPPLNALAGDVADIQFTATSMGNTTKSMTLDLRIVVNQIFGLELGAPVSHLKLLPGEEGEFELLLTNPGNGPDTYEVETPTDLDAGWWPTVPEPFITIEHNSVQGAVVRFAAPEPSPAGSAVQFSLRVSSTRSGIAKTVPLSAEVIQFFDNHYQLVHREREADVGTKVVVPVTIENRGNGPVDYDLDVLAPSSDWSAGFGVPSMSVSGYGWAETNLTFTLPGNAVNRSYSISVSIVPSGGDHLAHNFSFSVRQFHELELLVVSEHPTLTQGGAAAVRLKLRNLGNGVEEVRLLVPDIPDLWGFELEGEPYAVEPFSDLEAVVRIQTNRVSPGGDYQVGFLARYGPAPQLTSGTSASLTLLTRADLRALGGMMNTSAVEPFVGDLMQVSIEMENAGETPATDVYVQFYLDSQPLGQPLYVSSVDPGEVVMLSTTWMCNESGVHELSVQIDSTKDVDETVEDNNRASVQVNVRKLNLRTSPGPGGPVVLLALCALALVLAVRRRRP